MSTNNKRALITGVLGQDGSYLAELLLREGFEVFGVAHTQDKVREGMNFVHDTRCTIFQGDLCDVSFITECVVKSNPTHVYNFAAVSDLKTAKEQPEYTYAVNFTAFHDLARIVYEHDKQGHIFTALSSRIIKADDRGVISESSPYSEPQNEYDRAKRDCHEKIILPYRNEGRFILGGYLANHESPRRGSRFVTGKIAHTVAEIRKGSESLLEIGNVCAKRDWSHARDVVRAAHMALSHHTPHDYVIGSGTLHTVEDFITEAFRCIDMELRWEGEGIERCAYDTENILRVKTNPEFYAPDDNPVVTDTTKLTQETGWKSEVSFQSLVQEMVSAELK